MHSLPGGHCERRRGRDQPRSLHLVLCRHFLGLRGRVLVHAVPRRHLLGRSRRLVGVHVRAVRGRHLPRDPGWRRSICVRELRRRHVLGQRWFVGVHAVLAGLVLGRDGRQLRRNLHGLRRGLRLRRRRGAVRVGVLALRRGHMGTCELNCLHPLRRRNVVLRHGRRGQLVVYLPGLRTWHCLVDRRCPVLGDLRGVRRRLFRCQRGLDDVSALRRRIRVCVGLGEQLHAVQPRFVRGLGRPLDVLDLWRWQLRRHARLAQLHEVPRGHVLDRGHGRNLELRVHAVLCRLRVRRGGRDACGHLRAVCGRRLRNRRKRLLHAVPCGLVLALRRWRHLERRVHAVLCRLRVRNRWRDAGKHLRAVRGWALVGGRVRELHSVRRGHCLVSRRSDQLHLVRHVRGRLMGRRGRDDLHAVRRRLLLDRHRRWLRGHVPAVPGGHVWCDRWREPAFAVHALRRRQGKPEAGLERLDRLRAVPAGLLLGQHNRRRRVLHRVPHRQLLPHGRHVAGH